MVYKIYRGNNQVPKEKGPTTTRVCCLCPTDQTGLHGNPARTPVRPVHRPVRPVRQKQSAAHLALKCATRRLPNLRVSLHDLPPLCIPADEFDTTGAEVDVLGPEIIWVATNPEHLILSKSYLTSGYNLAHIPRHARFLAGGYFAEKRLK